MSSRIRLARNLAEFPFMNKAQDQDRVEIEKTLKNAALSLPSAGPVTYVSVNEIQPVDRQFLVERQFISLEMSNSRGARGVVVNQPEQLSLMINEEDHLRIQCLHSGLDLRGAWEHISRIDDELGKQVNYAFHPRWGYLTACPTNVGQACVSVCVATFACIVDDPAVGKGLSQFAKDQSDRAWTLRRRFASQR